METMANGTATTDKETTKMSTDKKTTKKASTNGTASKPASALPQLPKRPAHDVQVGMRLSEDEQRTLLEKAAKKGMTSMSNFLRDAVGLPPLR